MTGVYIMPELDFNEMEQTLSKGRLFPAYLVFGPEHYLLRLIVDKISQVYCAETGAEVSRYSAEGLDAVKVVDELKTLPMWARGKLVIISGASKLSPKAKELIGNYLEKPSASSVLVLVSAEFDGRSKLYKTALKNGAVVKIKQIYDNQMNFWINREVRNKGRNIAQNAAAFMTELVGTDLSAMAAAVEKIILYIGDKKMIDLKDVETVLSDTSQKSIFDLANAVGSKDLAKASARLLNLLRNNEEPVIIVNMLARHWRLLLKAKELMEKGRASDYELAGKLGVNPFFAKDYISQSRGFTRNMLIKGLKTLWRSDVAVKSSRLPKDAILHNLVIELIGSATTRSS